MRALIFCRDANYIKIFTENFKGNLYAKCVQKPKVHNCRYLYMKHA